MLEWGGCVRLPSGSRFPIVVAIVSINSPLSRSLSTFINSWSLVMGEALETSGICRMTSTSDTRGTDMRDGAR